MSKQTRPKMSLTTSFFSLLTLLWSCHVAGDLPQGMLFTRETETRQVKFLDGMWDFRADISFVGFEEMWYSLPLAERGEVLSMPVPSSYNDITEERWLRDFIGWVWYEKVFYVPPSWITTPKRVILRFESVFYHCKVWLNNREILEHEGGDLPFEVDITKEVRAIKSLHRNSHRLTVAVNNTLLFSMPLRKFESETSRSSYCDSSNEYIIDVDFAGIHGSVKLYTTPEVYISDITYTTNHDYNKASIKFITKVDVDEHMKQNQIIMNYELLDRQGRVAASVGGKKIFRGEMTVVNPTLWWPIGMSDTTGYLYTLKVTASYKEIHDVYRLPVGFRTVRVEGSRFLINNIPFYFKGFGKIQDSEIRGRGFDYVTLVRDFNLMKWFGANAIRTTKHPPPKELLELTDRHGIVVIDESPPVGPKEIFMDDISDHTINRHLDLLTELVQRDKDHPSVVMWSIASHRWTWPSENMTSHLKKMMEFTKEIDMQKRPVTYVASSEDRWSVVEDSALQFCDVISFNRHYGWYWYPGQPDFIAKSLEEDLRGLHNVFSKPVLMAEYGGSAVAGKHKQPSMIYSEEYQVDTMKKYFPVFDKLRKEFLVGEMIWTFTDYSVLESYNPMSANTKGLLTRQRQPKASAHALRLRYQASVMDAHPRFTGDELLDTLIRFKPSLGTEYPIIFKDRHRLPALIREERVNTTIRKRSVDHIMVFYEP